MAGWVQFAVVVEGGGGARPIGVDARPGARRGVGLLCAICNWRAACRGRAGGLPGAAGGRTGRVT